VKKYRQVTRNSVRSIATSDLGAADGFLSVVVGDDYLRTVGVLPGICPAPAFLKVDPAGRLKHSPRTTDGLRPAFLYLARSSATASWNVISNPSSR
jgi:hypothetical protein